MGMLNVSCRSISSLRNCEEDVRVPSDRDRCTDIPVRQFRVESRCGAVAVGRTYLLPPLSSDGALMARPWLRFHIPLIEPDRQISRIRLSESGGIEARTGLRMMPTSPRSPLSFRTAGFPQYGWKAGLSA